MLHVSICALYRRGTQIVVFPYKRQLKADESIPDHSPTPPTQLGKKLSRKDSVFVFTFSLRDDLVVIFTSSK